MVEVDYLPISLDIRGQKCLVVGGGMVAQRKVETLVAHGGTVTVVSPQLTAGLQELVRAGKINYVPRSYQATDLQNVYLVVAATADAVLNQHVAAAARAQGKLVNVVDAPQHSNFIMPATLRRGALAISVSTDGRSPLLAQRLREELEQLYGPEYAHCLEVLGAIRQQVLREVPQPTARREIFHRLLDTPLLAALLAGKEATVWAEAARLIAAAKGVGKTDA